jgi:MEDS: MEthanogen/methylotroph, DcmR Sensory domain
MVIILFVHKSQWGRAVTIQKSTNCHIDDALHHMNQAEHGAHFMIIYPNLDMLREIYSNYIHKQIEENNGTVLINPFYETTDSVKQVLSRKYNNDINEISKHEQEKSLIITDALESYFGEQNMKDKYFKMSLVNHATKIGKSDLSILGDMGAYHHKSKHEELVDYELSLPTKYEDGIALKGFCLYHQNDFDMLSDEQKQKLLEHHGKALRII